MLCINRLSRLYVYDHCSTTSAVLTVISEILDDRILIHGKHQSTTIWAFNPYSFFVFYKFSLFIFLILHAVSSPFSRLLSVCALSNMDDPRIYADICIALQGICVSLGFLRTDTRCVSGYDKSLRHFLCAAVH